MKAFGPNNNAFGPNNNAFVIHNLRSNKYANGAYEWVDNVLYAKMYKTRAGAARYAGISWPNHTVNVVEVIATIKQ